MGLVEQVGNRLDAVAGVAEGEEVDARQEQLGDGALVVVDNSGDGVGGQGDEVVVVHQEELGDVAEVLGLTEDALGARDGGLQGLAIRSVGGVLVEADVEDIEDVGGDVHRLEVGGALHEELPTKLTNLLEGSVLHLVALDEGVGGDDASLEEELHLGDGDGALLELLASEEVSPEADLVLVGLLVGDDVGVVVHGVEGERRGGVHGIGGHGERGGGIHGVGRHGKRNRSIHGIGGHGEGNRGVHGIGGHGKRGGGIHGVGGGGLLLRNGGARGLLAASALVGGTRRQQESVLGDGVVEEGGKLELLGRGGVGEGEEVDQEVEGVVGVAEERVDIQGVGADGVDEDNEVVSVGEVVGGVHEAEEVLELVEAADLVGVLTVDLVHRTNAKDFPVELGLAKHAGVDAQEDLLDVGDLEASLLVLGEVADVVPSDADLVRERGVVDGELLVVPEGLGLALRSVLALLAVEVVELVLQGGLELVPGGVVPDALVGAAVLEEVEEHEGEVALLLLLLALLDLVAEADLGEGLLGLLVGEEGALAGLGVTGERGTYDALGVGFIVERGGVQVSGHAQRDDAGEECAAVLVLAHPEADEVAADEALVLAAGEDGVVEVADEDALAESGLLHEGSDLGLALLDDGLHDEGGGHGDAGAVGVEEGEEDGVALAELGEHGVGDGLVGGVAEVRQADLEELHEDQDDEGARGLGGVVVQGVEEGVDELLVLEEGLLVGGLQLLVPVLLAGEDEALEDHQHVEDDALHVGLEGGEDEGQGALRLEEVQGQLRSEHESVEALPHGGGHALGDLGGLDGALELVEDGEVGVHELLLLDVEVVAGGGDVGVELLDGVDQVGGVGDGIAVAVGAADLAGVDDGSHAGVLHLVGVLLKLGSDAEAGEGVRDDQRHADEALGLADIQETAEKGVALGMETAGRAYLGATVLPQGEGVELEGELLGLVPLTDEAAELLEGNHRDDGVARHGGAEGAHTCRGRAR